MFKLTLEGLKDQGLTEIEAINIENFTNKIDLKEDYITKINNLVKEHKNYKMGTAIKQITFDEALQGQLYFIYSKAETVECGILLLKDKKLKIIGAWPERFVNAIENDIDIFKSLIYRVLKTPDFFEKVVIYNYPIPAESVKQKEVSKTGEEKEKTEPIEKERPKIPTKPEKPIEKEASKEEEEYIIPELPFKKKIVKKVTLDFEQTPQISTSVPEPPKDAPESYGGSLVAEIDQIFSAYKATATKKEDENADYWNSCPFCYTILSENTIKLLKAGLATFCPNNKCRKMIKSEYMVKKGKK